MKKIDNFFGKYRFLSNFYYSKVEFDGKEYPTIEHAYQASKTLDKWKRELIKSQLSPGRAKRMGTKLSLRKDWEEVRIEIMTDLVRQKFTNNELLKQKLIATGDQELIEGNRWGDTFWGVCNGVGENHLGKILMKLRESSSVG